MTFESFHVLKNVCDNIIELLKGKVGATHYPSRKLCEAEGVNPYLWSPNMKSTPLWQLSDRKMAKADATMAAVRIPFRYRGTSQIYNPYKQTNRKFDRDATDHFSYRIFIVIGYFQYDR